MKKFLWLWVPVLAWMGMIFYSSSQPYQNQDMRPTLMEYINMELVKAWFSWVRFDYADYEISIAHLGAAGFIEFFLRKGAHFCVFFVLGILLCRALSHYKLVKWKAMVYALLITAAYAALDEVHQSFTGDRTPLWQDSLLDTVGGLVGIIVWSMWSQKYILRNRKGR